MIKFETIRWKNFLSTGDQMTEIFLTKTASCLIIGSNGAGKSTILDALCFVLFNKPFRKINKPQLINSINNKNMLVEVEFSVSNTKYLIRRGVKPNVFEIFENGKLIDQDAANRDYQKYLETSILKLNFKSFTQVVILGSSTFVPFMQLPAAHRREVIEDLLDINVFSVMNTLLKDRMADLKQKDSDCKHLLRLSEEKLKLQESNVKNLENVQEDRVNEKLLKIKNNETKIVTSKKKLDETLNTIKVMEEGLDDGSEIESSLDTIKEIKIKLSEKARVLQNDIKFFDKNAVCPTCTQSLSDEFRNTKITTLSSKKDVVDSGLLEIQSKSEEVLEQLRAYNDSIKQIESYRKISNSLERDIVSAEFENLQINKEIIELQSNTPNIDNEKKKYEDIVKDYNSTKDVCSEVSKQKDEYTVAQSLLKDTGIKSLIIKKYIPIFNKLINKYLHSMDFYVQFTLDENFDERIMSRCRDSFSYSSFSEGEKQKIDLALLFTWREVARMKNSASTNLLILDEVFDSSLDDASTQELFKILNGLGAEANIFVISHKGEILVDRFKRTLKFEKVNDFSKLTVDK